MANLSRPPPPQSPKTEERFGRKPAAVSFCCSGQSGQSNIHVKQNHKLQLRFREKSRPCPRLRMQMKTFGSSTKCKKIRCQTLLQVHIFLHFTCHLWARAFKLCLLIYKMQKYHIYPISTAASLFPRSRWQLQNKYPWLWITGLRCWPCICVSLETISPPPPHISSNLSAVRCLQRDKKSPEIIKEIKIVSKHHPNINSCAPKNALFLLIDETFHYSYPVTW